MVKFLICSVVGVFLFFAPVFNGNVPLVALVGFLKKYPRLGFDQLPCSFSLFFPYRYRLSGQGLEDGTVCKIPSGRWDL